MKSETKDLKGVMVTFKELEKAGFDFNVFDYRANLIVNKDYVLKNVLIIEGRAVIINKDKSSVLIVLLSDNPGVEVEKIIEN